MLPWIDVGRLEADIQAVIRRTAPDVVITFGEDGLYWHPDHIAVHERTTAAVATLDDDVPALYYVTMPTGAMRRWRAAVLFRKRRSFRCRRRGLRPGCRPWRPAGHP
jgi:LmbE family N-acetylglucosaminyl deacetylase